MSFFQNFVGERKRLKSLRRHSTEIIDVLPMYGVVCVNEINQIIYIIGQWE